MRARLADMLRTVVGRRESCLVAVLLVLGVLGSVVRGDIIHLKSGGSIEGEVISEKSTEELLFIRTLLGSVTLGRDAIDRIEPAASPFEAYEKRAAAAGETAAAQTKLAGWCEARGLHAERRRHLERAILLDPDYEPARRALGFVRVGGVWIDGRSSVPNPEGGGDSGEPSEDEKLARAIQGRWHLTISAIESAFLEGDRDERFERGRKRILGIRDPLAIHPLTKVLSEGSEAARLLLVEALSGFRESESTLNLSILALIDGSEAVREAALSELVRRRDPRVVAQYRRVLQGEGDRLLKRAAIGLGRMKAAEAIPELIDALTVRRTQPVQVPVHGLTYQLRAPFGDVRYATVEGWRRIMYVPTIAVSNYASVFRNEWRVREVKVFRTEVLEALKAITGENFGFEREEWARWYREHRL